MFRLLFIIGSGTARSALPGLSSRSLSAFFACLRARDLDAARRYAKLTKIPFFGIFVMHTRHTDHGFSLVEILLALGILSALAMAAFLLYPTVIVRVHADADKRAISAAYANLTQLMRAGSAGRFNTDASSNDPPFMGQGAALSSVMSPLKCGPEDGVPWGSFACSFQSAGVGDVWFLAVAPCADDGCSSYQPPYDYFSIRFDMYDVPTANCLALLSGFGSNGTDTGASAVYIIKSDWSYRELYLNSASPLANVEACQDPANSLYSMIFDFWPWGDPYHSQPSWGG
jgi:prepilin-type N-terminal cleavage/methylation domain-containing protein